MKKVNILGTEYTIEIVNISECEELRDNKWCGECKGIEKKILVGNAREDEYFGKLTDYEKEQTMKETTRHEIIHAFFNESGLQDSSMQYCNGWAKNEEMVDWFAIQFPKILKVFEEVGCL